MVAVADDRETVRTRPPEQGARKMSAVSSVTGNGQALYQFLQGVQGSTQAGAATNGAGADRNRSTGQVQGGHHHHHHGGGHGGEFSKVESAVNDALQQA